MIVLSVEGVDYSGKSTLITHVSEILNKAGWDVVVQNFPSNCGHGKTAREGLAAGESALVVSHHLELNFLELSKQFMDEYGNDDNTVIILDRYVATTRAHQDHIVDISEGDFLIPDIQVLLTLSHEKMMERKKERGGVDWDKAETDRHSSRGGWSLLNQRYEEAAEDIAETHNIEHSIQFDGEEEKADIAEEICDLIEANFG